MSFGLSRAFVMCQISLITNYNSELFWEINTKLIWVHNIDTSCSFKVSSSKTRAMVNMPEGQRSIMSASGFLIKLDQKAIVQICATRSGCSYNISLNKRTGPCCFHARKFPRKLSKNRESIVFEFCRYVSSAGHSR